MVSRKTNLQNWLSKLNRYRHKQNARFKRTTNLKV